MGILLVLFSVSVASRPGRRADRSGDRRGDCPRCRFPQAGTIDRRPLGRPLAVQSSPRPDRARGAGPHGKRRRSQCPRDQPRPACGRRARARLRPDLRPCTGDLVPGSVPARTARRGRPIDPDPGPSPGARRSRRHLGLLRPARAAGARSGSGRSRGIDRRKARPEIQRNSGQGDNSNTQFALLGLWAAGRHGFDSDAVPRVDRPPFSLVAAVRRPLGLQVWASRLRVDVVRRAHGPGDCRIETQPGRAADRARAEARPSPPTKAFTTAPPRGRPGRSPRQSRLRHLLSLVARTGMRRSRFALARRI